MKAIPICLLCIMLFSFKCFALPNDSVHFKRFHFGFEIPYSSISEKNLKAITNGTADSKTKFFTGVSVLCKYNLNKQLAVQTGAGFDFGQYVIMVPSLIIYSHRFNELQIPIKFIYEFNKNNSRFNLFATAGYSLSFINNNTKMETEQFEFPLPSEYLLSNKYFQSTASAQIGCSYRAKKIKLFICLNANYSSYWKEYYGLSTGLYFK
jgi:hypothetical protein